MFSVYQKIVTPETSPVLGPINANNVTTVNAPEPFLLCNYCCSHRTNKSDTASPINRDSTNTTNRDSTNTTNTTHTTNRDSTNTINPQSDLDLVESKYPFGHATHYTYRVTTPRILFAFETGTPPSP